MCPLFVLRFTTSLKEGGNYNGLCFNVLFSHLGVIFWKAVEWEIKRDLCQKFLPIGITGKI